MIVLSSTALFLRDRSDAPVSWAEADLIVVFPEHRAHVGALLQASDSARVLELTWPATATQVLKEVLALPGLARQLPRAEPLLYFAAAAEWDTRSALIARIESAPFGVTAHVDEQGALGFLGLGRMIVSSPVFAATFAHIAARSSDNRSMVALLHEVFGQR